MASTAGAAVAAATAAPAVAASPAKPVNPMAVAPWYDWWPGGRTNGRDDRELHWALFPTTRPYTLLRYTNQTPQSETARPATPSSTPQWGISYTPPVPTGQLFSVQIRETTGAINYRDAIPRATSTLTENGWPSINNDWDPTFIRAISDTRGSSPRLMAPLVRTNTGLPQWTWEFIGSAEGLVDTLPVRM